MCIHYLFIIKRGPRPSGTLMSPVKMQTVDNICTAARVCVVITQISQKINQQTWPSQEPVTINLVYTFRQIPRGLREEECLMYQSDKPNMQSYLLWLAPVDKGAAFFC